MKKSAVGSEMACHAEESLIKEISGACDDIYCKVLELEELLRRTDDTGSCEETARFYCDEVIPCMEKIRKTSDELESITAAEYWPMPSYGDMLFA